MENTQLQYYDCIDQSWITQWILKFWDIAWDMWDRQNKILHHQAQTDMISEIREIVQC